MSKATELRALRYGRSIDAPINYRHRTGDSESGGNMLDLYAQAESAEDVYFGNADERAREMFVRGFRVYLKKVFTEQEREFLKRLLAGKESPYKIGRSLGVEHFAFLQSLQKKAFKNVKPLDKLTKMTGWSGAEEFTQTIYERLEQLTAGFALNEIIPQNARVIKKRQYNRQYGRQHPEKIAASNKKYREAHREEIRALLKAYREAHREKLNANKRIDYQKHREECIKKRRTYREQHPEKIAASNKKYREAHREEKREQERAHYAAHREEIIAKKRAYQKAHREEMKAYREAHREEMKAYQKAYRARKKAERLAAIEAARSDESAGGKE